MATSKTKWSEFIDFRGAYFVATVIVICLGNAAYLGNLIPKHINELSATYGEVDKFYQVMWDLFWISVFVYINRAAYQLLVNKYVQLIIQSVRKTCYQKWLLNYEIRRGGESTYDRYPMGEVLARLMNDTEAFRELITSGTFGILIDLFFVVSALISFIGINRTSGLFLTGVEVAVSIFLIWGSKYMRQVFLSVRRSRGDMSRKVANVVGGVSETFYTDHQRYGSLQCVPTFDDFLKKQLVANVWDASYYSLAESLYPILLAMVVLIFPYSGITEAAVIFAIVDIIQRSIGPVKDVASKIANVQRAASGFQRIGEFVGDLDEGYSSPKEQVFAKQRDFESLEVHVDSFQYEESPEDSEEHQVFALKDIHFEGKRGELLGLVGLSGSGKSTLLNIMSGNIIPDHANLILHCRDCEDIHYPGSHLEDIIAYREQVGIVSQESHIFTKSLSFNICMTHETPTDFEEFWTNLWEQLPYLKEWGIQPEQEINPKEMSLGQKQLIAALRACYLKKTVVLFDEISSGLDSKLEQALRKMVLLVQKNSLTVIVAHRLETIMQADKIFVMKNGRLVSSGNHRALMTESSVYRRFVDELSHSPAT